ncbi:hypothetical protein HDU79_002502, partial [Rhizoclosmatium sp. JEL0117]
MSPQPRRPGQKPTHPIPTPPAIKKRAVSEQDEDAFVQSSASESEPSTPKKSRTLPPKPTPSTTKQ